MPAPLILRIEILLALSLALSFFGWGKRLLFPFQVFTTWVHECCHATAAILLGGSDIRITISPDSRGLTEFRMPKNRFKQAIVASAGYLGASLVGCLIFYLSAELPGSRIMLSTHSLVLALCVLVSLSLILWIRNAFGWISFGLLAVGLGALNYYSLYPYARAILIFLGIQTALNALLDIRGSQSDAQTLQRLFYLPAWFWSMGWVSVSLFMIYWVFKRF